MRGASVTSVTSVTAMRGEMRGGHHSPTTREDMGGHPRHHRFSQRLFSPMQDSDARLQRESKFQIPNHH